MVGGGGIAVGRGWVTWRTTVGTGWEMPETSVGAPGIRPCAATPSPSMRVPVNAVNAAKGIKRFIKALPGDF
jgi:hypothetical protein